MLRILETVPWDLLAAWLLANVIPYISALLTRRPSALTGYVTIALSFVVTLLTTVSATHGDFDWKKIIGGAFVTWAVARLHYNTAVKGETANVIHANFGVKGSSTARTRQAA